MSELILFPFSLWVFALVGVVVSWAKMTANQRHIYGLSAMVARFSSNERLKSIIELVIFVTIGCLISIGVTKPTNEAQALAAGLAWTGMMAVK
jgi:hypothetical protein